MGFEKGHQVWNKGKKLTKTHVRHMKEAGAGFEVGHTPWNKGIPLTQAHKDRVSKTQRRRAKLGVKPWNYGKHLSEAYKEKLSQAAYARYYPEFSQEPEEKQGKGFLEKIFGGEW